MYAIVQVGSQQYKVSEGDCISVQRLEEKGPTINLEKVLFYENAGAIKIGQPFLSDVKVKADILGEEKDAKVVSFKYLRRKNTSWKKGHRQKLTVLKISKIESK
ncbi:MAG: 50S ribosomal protein L21 [Candidatus Omnitrophica bacterium]|nr:50S ribosomal protein L21 [Candidatus Omnitrophota bacterium]